MLFRSPVNLCILHNRVVLNVQREGTVVARLDVLIVIMANTRTRQACWVVRRAPMGSTPLHSELRAANHAARATMAWAWVERRVKNAQGENTPNPGQQVARTARVERTWYRRLNKTRVRSAYHAQAVDIQLHTL